MQRRHLPAVPKTTAVIPGASVNIVLKADQPTGRTVCGVVRDVLTRGDHPRGIKVRLADGRVGRVQSMASAAADDRETHNAGLMSGRDGDGDGGSGSRGGVGFHEAEGRGSRGGLLARGGGRGERGGGGGAREHEEDGPSQQIGLDAYVKEARPKRKTKKTQASAELSVAAAAAAAAEEGRGDPSSPSETLSCPVCNEFKGDEAAISHHVATHFD